VLCATTKQTDLWEIIARFSHLPIKQLIFTKLDETLRYGVILNVVSGVRKGLVYVTTGQDVPDDIEVADPIKLAQLILQVNNDERSGRKIKAPY
jgi:flagellar biosynthesis protein FlhF